LTELAAALCTLQAVFATCSSPQSGHAVLGDHGQIHIDNFSAASSDGPGNIHYSGTGSPVVVENTDLGLRMQATSVDCTVSTNAVGKTVLSTATLDGAAQIWLDTAQSDAAKVAAASREGRPAPPASNEISKIHLASPHIDYAADATGGVATCLRAVDYTDDVDGHAATVEPGQAVPVRYAETIHVTGTGAVLALLEPISDAAPKIKPKTLHIDGPTQLDLTRNETRTPAPAAPSQVVPRPRVPAAKLRSKRPAAKGALPVVPPHVAPESPISTTTVTVLHGVGDRFDADFVAPPLPTMVLTGNVSIDGTGSTLRGRTYADKAIVFLVPGTQEPKSYQFTGQPAVSQIRPAATVGALPK
jgi:hypothetical protein